MGPRGRQSGEGGCGFAFGGGGPLPQESGQLHQRREGHGRPSSGPPEGGSGSTLGGGGGGGGGLNLLPVLLF